MAVLYELAILGVPTAEQLADVKAHLSVAVQKFGMELDREISLAICPDSFSPAQNRAAAAVFFGAKDAPLGNLTEIVRRGVPVLPVASDLPKVAEEIPEILRRLNCLSYTAGGGMRVASALLECAGLLPRQRRVFLSYRRDEAREAALQLFDALSSRQFDVFLDTHDILPAEDFQTMLWHRLCDSDVLIMLDTPNYFASRWTTAEFGRALAKSISVLQIVYPGTTPSPRTATARRLPLAHDDVEGTSGRLTDKAVSEISLLLEEVRSESYAVRNLNLVSAIRSDIERIGGKVDGVGLHKAVSIALADGRNILVYPVVGVPTSTTMHDSMTNAPDRSIAVVYDHVGLHPKWLDHIDWLSSHIPTARCVKSTEVAWQFADWET